MKPLARIALLGLTLTPLLVFADDSFVPLTSVPGLASFASSSSMPEFLNSLYRLCIGAVAVLAVLQITFAGWQFMTSADSITKNQKAKQTIQNAVFGLVLVLSPAIVFGLINPSILDLKLDFSTLHTPFGTISASNPQGGTPASTPPAQGDESCNTKCPAGTVCKAGRCMTADPAPNSCQKFPEGKTTIGKDLAKQACCSAQQGCTLKMESKFVFFGSEVVCSCNK